MMIEPTEQKLTVQAEPDTSRGGRDGVWRTNGLEADFRLIYQHPNCPNIYRVQTVSGEHYASGDELRWDFAPSR